MRQARETVDQVHLSVCFLWRSFEKKAKKNWTKIGLCGALGLRAVLHTHTMRGENQMSEFSGSSAGHPRPPLLFLLHFEVHFACNNAENHHRTATAPAAALHQLHITRPDDELENEQQQASSYTARATRTRGRILLSLSLA